MKFPCLPSRPRAALVLVGGAARGAYEVGVVSHLLEDVARDLGRDVPLDILCGTSIGGINACFLAAWADEPRARAEYLTACWRSLALGDIVRPVAVEVMALLAGILVREPRIEDLLGIRGGMLDPRGFTRLLGDIIPFERIPGHLAAGRLDAVTVSTTHVATGRTVVFLDRAPHLPPLADLPDSFAPVGRLGLSHALASAAVPLLFPAVRIGGGLYCDGGLRQNVPLSPAHHLGASALLVVNPHPSPEVGLPPAALMREREEAARSPLFLMGKALNALLLDRIDTDIDRLERVNEILAAGCRRFGPGFLPGLNEELARVPGAKPVKYLRTAFVRASQDIGMLAASYVRSQTFADRAPGMLGRVMRSLASAEADTENDLLSYLLFDGEFAAELMALGRADARAQHEELCRLFAELGEAEAREG